MTRLKSFLYGLFLASLSMFIVVSVFAQDSLNVGGTGGNVSIALPDWVRTAALIALGVYEIVIRYIPTAKNYSIIGLVIKLIQTLVPSKNSNVPTNPHP